MRQERDKLYRDTALAHKMLGPQSAPVIRQRSYLKVQLWLWSAILMATLYLLTKTQYKETAAAMGVLQPSAGTQKIISPATAVVKDIYVESGDHVKKGQMLASLSTDLFDARGHSRQEELIRQLHSDRQLLLKQITVQQNSRNLSRNWNTVARSNLQQNRENLQREAELLAVRINISDKNLEALAKLLGGGNISPLQYDRQYATHLELLGIQQALQQRTLQNTLNLENSVNSSQLTELEFEKGSLQLQRELEAIDLEVTTLANQTTLTLIAEQEGIVAEIGLEPGTSVLLNQPLFYIDPLELELQATIFVPASIQGKLAPGQFLMLRFDAFDYRIYGRYRATITSIGRARLDPRESMLPILAINEPVFKVTANLDQAYVEGSDIYRLQSGMTLFADFVITEMSLLEFIFRPILSLQGKVS